MNGAVTKGDDRPPGGPLGKELGLRQTIRAFCLFMALALHSFAVSAATPDWLPLVLPEGETIGAFTGTPKAAVVSDKGKTVGYVFSTQEVIGSTGYAGKPIDILVGLDLEARITGAFLASHEEPILIIGVSDQDLENYVAGFAGLAVGEAIDLEEVGTRPGLPDTISGATISSAVIRDAVIRSARAVATSRRLLAPPGGGPQLDRESFEPADWPALVADGSLSHLRLTLGERDAAFAAQGQQPAEAQATERAENLFIELYAGLATPPRVGENLLGKAAFNRLAAEIGVADQLIFVAGNGLYSFKGTAYRRTGLFDRLQLVQDALTIRFTEESYRFVEKLQAAGAPDFREIAVFAVPAESGFDPLRPWRLELLVERRLGDAAVQRAIFPLTYALPARYRIGEEAAAGPDWTAGLPGAGVDAGQPLWIGLWQKRRVEIAALVLLLIVLTGLLVFQDALVRDRRVYRGVRIAFLAVTLVWLGWIAGGQLSVINVLTFVNALLSDFRWEFFLVDPIVFLLWSYVAVALLFWGRGVFCGWLCPFGALQELLNDAARKLRVPQVNLPFVIHERLWPIKYILFLGLFAVSLHSSNLAVFGAEVEPFKTAIALRFVRAWPFVLYAVLLLAAGLFIERFFCRYLCPLGAALAIPARLRMFDWLKRKHQCGRECHICAVHCTVQAIHPNGTINPNECIHCLNCQNFYYDDHTCPPLIARRKRRESRQARRSEAASGSPSDGA